MVVGGDRAHRLSTRSKRWGDEGKGRQSREIWRPSSRASPFRYTWTIILGSCRRILVVEDWLYGGGFIIDGGTQSQMPVVVGFFALLVESPVAAQPPAYTRLWMVLATLTLPLYRSVGTSLWRLAGGPVHQIPLFSSRWNHLCLRVGRLPGLGVVVQWARTNRGQRCGRNMQSGR